MLASVSSGRPLFASTTRSTTLAAFAASESVTVTVSSVGVLALASGAVALGRMQMTGVPLVTADCTINEPRYPSFKGIMAAKSKPLTTLTVADAGIDASQVGLTGATTEVREFTPRPPRAGGTIIKDEGDAAQKLAEFLQQQKFI